MTDTITLGRKIRDLREKAHISLRELARDLSISAPFLSDVELGRRFPSEEILAKLAVKLGVQPEELRDLDTRTAMSDIKRLVDSSPQLGMIFKSVVSQVNAGKLSSQEIAAKLKELYGQK
ncbi:MAG: helix-turn-helix transcriptional regulator [Opitutaceae bacterium]|jgi:transcriptional regulator with XRE-family HTH domain